MNRMLLQREYQLNSGFKIPSIGLGTWQIPDEDIERVLEDAVKVGYRHFDCAFRYDNQPSIGRAFAKLFSKGIIQRKDIFVTSKIWCTCHSYENASGNIDSILKELQLDYLDLCLIHWPTSFQENSDPEPRDHNGKLIYSEDDYLTAWKAMEDASFAGKIRSLGASNLNRDQLDRILKNCRIKPSNLQNETHPYLPQEKAINYCKRNDIIYTAYSPLGALALVGRCSDKNLLQEPVIKGIGSKYSKTPAQVLLNWALRRGTVAIPKTTSSNRLKENFDVWDFSLDDEDMIKIVSLNSNLRFFAWNELKDHTYYPFHQDF